MTLHFYFARRFFTMFGTLFIVFALLQALLDLVEQLRRFGNIASFGEVAQLAALKLPEGIYQIIPLVMILATIAFFIGLARSSELVVTRAAGRSGMTVVAGPFIVSIVLGALIVAVLNPIVATTSKRYLDLRETYRTGSASVVSVGAEGLWLRQGSDDGQAVIHAHRTNAEATRLYDVSIVTYEPDGGPDRRILAVEAELQPGAWRLYGVKIWSLNDDENPDLTAQTFATQTLASNLTVESIRDRFGSPSAVAIWDLPEFISELEDAGFSARRHFVWMQMELARPLFLAAMVLVGAAFTMRPARLGRTGLAVLSAILLGFGLYYVRNFAQIMGENGQLPAMIAAWVPPLASVLLALGLILHMEDG